jgi:vanadium chloroperoxidase
MVVLPPTEEPAEYNTNYILYWNNVALDLNRLVT